MNDRGILNPESPMLETFTQHLGLSPEISESLLSRSLNEVLSLPEVNQLLGSLNTALLQQTLPTAGSVLAQHLPLFYNWLQTKLAVSRVPDSPSHATTWVVNFLNHEESLTHLVELHQPVPRLALESAIPRLVSLFDTVEADEVRQEWQKAVSALCLVLAVAARERDR